ncbi:MAG: BolA/IbaG family iron-sulfur metabolism protein [Alphaproteobacteria bacterium]|nr:BolA/IbaG family iron-sulfur metabolism protein [Alphaproteobacteria bacterium]
MKAEELADLIKRHIPDAIVCINDVRGDGRYFSATVTSAQFAGLSRIQQHQKVHQALSPVIGNDDGLALQLTTRES